MRSPTAWKLTAFAFAGTTLLLAGVLAFRAPRDRGGEPLPAPSPAAERPSAPPPRRHVEPPAQQAVPLPPAADEAADATARARSALAAMDVREALYRCCIVSAGGAVEGISFDLLMERLGRDRDEAVRVLDDWVARFADLDRQDVDAQPWLFDAYAELRGADAIPGLRALADRSGVLPALIRAGATEEVEAIGAAYRDPDKGIVEPLYVGRAGPRGIAYLRRWAADERIPAERRRKVRATLWFFGTDEDRDDLWDHATALERLTVYGGTHPHWPVDWDARRRARIPDWLDDPDPLVRLHAETRILNAPRAWPEALRSAALARARDDVRLPRTGTAPEPDWQTQQRLLQAILENIDRDARRRRLLGLE